MQEMQRIISISWINDALCLQIKYVIRNVLCLHILFKSQEAQPCLFQRLFFSKVERI